jgi:hypothetical protein
MYGKQMTVRLDAKLYQVLEKEAEKEMHSVASLVRLILAKRFGTR